jgi:hypothetical protein
MMSGIDGFDEALKDMGVDGLSDLVVYLQNAIYVIVLANAIVVVYGFREKCRIRNDILGHISFCCLPGLIKFLVKTVIHLVVCAALLICLILAFVMEGVYVLFLAIDGACGTGGDAVQSIVDLMPGESENPIDEMCDAAKNGLDATREVFIGCLILAAAEIIIIAYWYKYSTLAMVTPFYGSESKYDSKNMKRKKDEKAAAKKNGAKDEKADDLEMAIPPTKAPRKV